MTSSVESIQSKIRNRRKVTGMSAILLPFNADHSIDWNGFEAHVSRTLQHGLTPAVNMDTGYANLIDAETRKEVLQRTNSIAKGQTFLAGAFIQDRPGDSFAYEPYAAVIEQIQTHGGTPIVFQSYGLAHAGEDDIVSNYSRLAKLCDRFYGFELGTMFAPFGAIYSLEVFQGLMEIPQLAGAKHSSLQRSLEWQRLTLRDEHRPDFQILTGNDLAIDMVMYGSDYLLGLSTFCPDQFAKRDQMWETGDPGFYQLNDALQYLGCFAFRNPTSGYKHNAAMFLKGRNWIPTDLTHPDSVARPETDYKVLYEIGRQLGLEMQQP